MKKDKLIQDIRIVASLNEDFYSTVAECINIGEYHNFASKNHKIDNKKDENKQRLEIAIKMEKLFEEAISKIRIKYNLSQSYHEPLKEFLENGESEPMTIKLNNDSLNPFVVKSPIDNKKEILVLPITAETTTKDIIKNWKHIEKARSIFLNKKKLRKKSKRINLNRDIEIYNLKKEGKKAKEITSIINKKYNIVGYEDISKITRRLKDAEREIRGT